MERFLLGIQLLDQYLCLLYEAEEQEDLRLREGPLTMWEGGKSLQSRVPEGGAYVPLVTAFTLQVAFFTFTSFSSEPQLPSYELSHSGDWSLPFSWADLNQTAPMLVHAE